MNNGRVTYTPSHLVKLMIEHSSKLDEAQDALMRATYEEADAAHLYRYARANAYLATTGTVGEREAYVEKTVAMERRKAHLAEALTRSALEAVRNRRTQLSVLQTVANSVKEEAALARTAPDV